jgi:hypothetical protein
MKPHGGAKRIGARESREGSRGFRAQDPATGGRLDPEFTIHATERDLGEHEKLPAILRGKAGRIVVNEVPTGVEATHAMHHGGPWPATTDPRATSVGGIWRLVDGRLTRDPL